MARPQKQPAERRTDTLSFRLTAAERVALDQAAAAAGMSASVYARTLSLTGRVVVRRAQALDHAVFDELRRIGVNLNQLTRLANQGRAIPAEIARTARALEALLARELGADLPEPPPAADPDAPPGPGTGAPERAAPSAPVPPPPRGPSHGP